MLTDSFDSLLESDMFKGAIAYGQPIDRKPWYGYLYIAKFLERDKLKIGIASKLDRRDMQLRLQNEYQDSGKIIYYWSVPINAEIESKVKEILFFFTRRYSEKSGKTEIFYGIPLYAFILVVRLIILYVFLNKGYITTIGAPEREKLATLSAYLGSLRIDGVKYGNVVYNRQDNLSSEKRIREIEKVVEEAVKLKFNFKDRGERPTFTPYKTAPEAREVIDRIKQLGLPDTSREVPVSVREVYDWLTVWLAEFTEDGKPNNKALRPTEGEVQELETNNTFRNGDIVWVTYPDNEDNRQKHPEWIGSWHARIRNPQTAGDQPGYRVEWLEDGFRGTTTTIPASWINKTIEAIREDGGEIRHDGGNLRRILDVLKVYSDIGVSTDIEGLREKIIQLNEVSDSDTTVSQDSSVKLKL